MKINKILSSATLLYGMSMAMSVGSCATPVQTNLPGYTPGADIISVSPTRNQVDLIGDVVYSQIKGTRSVRQLHMSVRKRKLTAVCSHQTRIGNLDAHLI